MNCARGCARFLCYLAALLEARLGWCSTKWKAELETEKALAFGHAWDYVKTRAFVLKVYLGFWEM